MAISYKLEKFGRSADLLLHLIEKNKVDIYDIPIVEITKQYLDYEPDGKKEDLNIVSDFLVMAATLLDIKSRMLLPPWEVEEGKRKTCGQAVARLLGGIQKSTSPWHRSWLIWRMRPEMFCLRLRPSQKRSQKYEPPVDLTNC